MIFIILTLIVSLYFFVKNLIKYLNKTSQYTYKNLFGDTIQAFFLSAIVSFFLFGIFPHSYVISKHMRTIVLNSYKVDQYIVKQQIHEEVPDNEKLTYIFGSGDLKKEYSVEITNSIDGTVFFFKTNDKNLEFKKLN